jgi:hypothetical protein
VNSPYEIEELFDQVESSKSTALLRMVEDEKNENQVLTALVVIDCFNFYLLKSFN